MTGHERATNAPWTCRQAWTEKLMRRCEIEDAAWNVTREIALQKAYGLALVFHDWLGRGCR